MRDKGRRLNGSSAEFRAAQVSQVFATPARLGLRTAQIVAPGRAGDQVIVRAIDACHINLRREQVMIQPRISRRFARHCDHNWRRTPDSGQVEKNLGAPGERQLSGSISLSRVYCLITIHLTCHYCRYVRYGRYVRYEQEECRPPRPVLFQFLKKRRAR